MAEGEVTPKEEAELGRERTRSSLVARSASGRSSVACREGHSGIPRETLPPLPESGEKKAVGGKQREGGW